MRDRSPLVHDRIDVDEHWYGGARRAIVVTWVLLLVVLALGLGFREYRQQQEVHVLHSFTSQLDAETEWMQRSAGTAVRRPYVDRVVTERVAGGSLAACKARTGRDTDESLSRCRSGYDVTRIVREYR